MIKFCTVISIILLAATFASAQTKNAAAIEKQLKSLKADKVFALVYDKDADNSKIYGFGADFGKEQAKRNAVESFRFGLAVFFAGKDLKTAPDEYVLTFQAGTKTAKFAEAHKLIFKIDGATLDLGDARYANKNGIEYLNFKISREQLSKLAKGKEILMKIGAAEFKLAAEHLKMFTDLYALSDPSTAN